MKALDAQFKPSASKLRNKITGDVWESLGLDDQMSNKGVRMRKETQRIMEGMEERLIPHINNQTWPDFVFPEIKQIGVNGLQIGVHGGPGLTTLEAGSIVYEMAKIDGSVAMSFLV